MTRVPIVVGELALIPLTRGCAAVIDAADLPIVREHQWFAAWNICTRSFYARTNTQSGASRTTLPMHRLLLGAASGQFVDHRDQDTLNNRRSNLRIATRVENGRNRSTKRDNTTGYIGVSHKSKNRWAAYTRDTGRRIHIGLYETPFEAALARDQYIREHLPSEFWTYNFPLLPGERGTRDTEEISA